MATDTIHERNLPTPSTGGKVVVIISLFVLISVLLVGMIFWYGTLFDGVRSYVRGEGLWAKAQKDAVFYLSQYSHSHSDTDYKAYREALKIITGDKNARAALQESPPNRKEARMGFLQGQNHPEDIDSLIGFFLNFQRFSYMREAIDIWRYADEKIVELTRIAEQIRHEIKTSGTESDQLLELRMRLSLLNDELQQLENRFSSVLSEGARWVKQMTRRVSVLALFVFIGIGLWVSRQIIKRIDLSEQQLVISESRFRSLKESNTIGIISWLLDGRIDEANDLFLTMTGYDRSEIVSGTINWRDITPYVFQNKQQEVIDELMAHGRCEPFETCLIHKKGHWVPVLVGAAMLNGDREQGIAFVMDLSERKKADQQLKLAATVFDGSSDGILITDSSTRIVSVNQALCSMTGFDEVELLGKTPRILQSGYTTPDEYQQIWESLKRNGKWQGDMVDRKKNGALLPIRASINQVRNGANQITHYVAILSDISERKAKEDQLRQIAHHDPLTGLPNRILFNDRIEQAIKKAIRNHGKFAVLFLDLDKFKPVNDLYGHKTGDHLLQSVANRIVRSVRETDTVTRLGGDEFVVLLEGISELQMVEKILEHTIDAVSRTYHIDDHSIEISVSAGISIYPHNGTDAKTLLHFADKAMYESKKSKTNSNLS